MTNDFFEGYLKPLGIALRVRFHVGGDVVETHVLERGHFLSVDDGGVVSRAEPHVVVLVFDEAEADGSLIYKGENLVHVAGEAHLFLQAACRGLFEALAVAGVAAAGVGPQPWGVVFG